MEDSLDRVLLSPGEVQPRFENAGELNRCCSLDNRLCRRRRRTSVNDRPAPKIPRVVSERRLTITADRDQDGQARVHVSETYEEWAPEERWDKEPTLSQRFKYWRQASPLFRFNTWRWGIQAATSTFFTFLVCGIDPLGLKLFIDTSGFLGVASAIVIMEATTGASLRKAGRRLVACTLGSVCAHLAYQLATAGEMEAGTSRSMMILYLIGTTVVIPFSYLRSVYPKSDPFSSYCIVQFHMSMLVMNFRKGSSWVIAMRRTSAPLIGIIISTIVAHVVFPAPCRPRIRQKLAEILRNVSDVHRSLKDHELDCGAEFDSGNPIDRRILGLSPRTSAIIPPPLSGRNSFLRIDIEKTPLLFDSEHQQQKGNVDRGTSSGTSVGGLLSSVAHLIQSGSESQRRTQFSGARRIAMPQDIPTRELRSVVDPEDEGKKPVTDVFWEEICERLRSCDQKLQSVQTLVEAAKSEVGFHELLSKESDKYRFSSEVYLTAIKRIYNLLHVTSALYTSVDVQSQNDAVNRWLLPPTDPLLLSDSRHFFSSSTPYSPSAFGSTPGLARDLSFSGVAQAIDGVGRAGGDRPWRRKGGGKALLANKQARALQTFHETPLLAADADSEHPTHEEEDDEREGSDDFYSSAQSHEYRHPLHRNIKRRPYKLVNVRPSFQPAPAARVRRAQAFAHPLFRSYAATAGPRSVAKSQPSKKQGKLGGKSRLEFSGEGNHSEAVSRVPVSAASDADNFSAMAEWQASHPAGQTGNINMLPGPLSFSFSEESLEASVHSVQRSSGGTAPDQLAAVSAEGGDVVDYGSGFCFSRDNSLQIGRQESFEGDLEFGSRWLNPEAHGVPAVAETMKIDSEKFDEACTADIDPADLMDCLNNLPRQFGGKRKSTLTADTAMLDSYVGTHRDIVTRVYDNSQTIMQVMADCLEDFDSSYRARAALTANRRALQEAQVLRHKHRVLLERVVRTSTELECQRRAEKGPRRRGTPFLRRWDDMWANADRLAVTVVRLAIFVEQLEECYAALDGITRVRMEPRSVVFT